MVLEVKVEPLAEHLLSLERIGPHGAQYRKHFLALDGLGVRELCEDGDDVLVLAGPTMDLDGHVFVLRWKNALVARKQQIVKRQDLETVLEFRFDHRNEVGTNHPEGIAIFRDGGTRRSLLVTYDSPGPEKQRGSGGIRADVFSLPA